MDTLTENNLVLGGKYVPHSKSTSGFTFDEVLSFMKEMNYKYIIYLGNNKFITEDGKSDIFLLPSDVTPYVKSKEKTPNAATPYSERYLEWVKQCKLPLLTNTQRKFAEWLLQEENSKVIAQIGDLDSIFISVRKFIKNNPKASI